MSSGPLKADAYCNKVNALSMGVSQFVLMLPRLPANCIYYQSAQTEPLLDSISG